MYRYKALFAVAALCAGAFAAAAAKKPLPRNDYGTLVIGALSAKPGVEVPADFTANLGQHLEKDIGKTKRFGRVCLGECPPEAGTASGAPQSARVLKLTGTIVDFDPGSRAKRYLSPALGTAEATIHLVLTDATSGKACFERDITGKMTGGLFGGKASGVVSDLSKEIAKTIKKEELTAP